MKLAVPGALVALAEDDGFKGELLAASLRTGWLIVHKHRAVAAEALDEMLALMRERVPQDTGRLLSGITGEIQDGMATVEASAVREGPAGEGADYARFVEFGTRAGTRGRRSPIVADEGFFAASPFDETRGRRVTRQRKSYRTHPGTPARPFFFNSASEVLARYRAAAAQAAVEALLAEFGQYGEAA